MKVQSKILEEFEHEHERIGFLLLRDLLEEYFYDKNLSAYLYGNLNCNGRNLDALLISNNIITVIELKNYGGIINIKENGPWFNEENITIRGGQNINPLYQVRSYKFALMESLNRYFKCSKNNPKKGLNFSHITGIVFFQQECTFKSTPLGSAEKWFKVSCPNSLKSSIGSLFSNHHINLKNSQINDYLSYIGAISKPSDDSRNNEKYYYLYKDLGLVQSVKELTQIGGIAGIAVNEFKKIRSLIKNSLPPFQKYQNVSFEAEKNFQFYEITNGYYLTVYIADKISIICLLGDKVSTSQWLENNKGILFTIDSLTREIKASYTHFHNNSLEIPISDLPYLKQIEGYNIKDFISDEKLIWELNNINLFSHKAEKELALYKLKEKNEGAYKDLKNIFELLDQGDIESANIKVKIIYNSAAPIEEFNELAISSTDQHFNTERIIDLADISDNQWETLLDKTKFREWLVYLHQDQKRIVNEDFKNVVELRGVSGSGKTCVLAHRAKRLAKLYNKPILILTLNKSLAKLIKNLVGDLCNDHEKQLIKVESYHEYICRLLKTVGLSDYITALGIVYNIDQEMQNFLSRSTNEDINRFFENRHNAEIYDLWKNFIRERKDSQLISRIKNTLEKFQNGINFNSYVLEEFELIRSAFIFENGYIEYKEEGNFLRNGRTVPLRSEQREDFLSLLKAWEKFQFINGQLDQMTLSQAALWALDEYGDIPKSLQYRSVLVDEYQDFSTLDIKLISKIPTEKDNSLFLTGDTGQKIFTKELSFEKAGIVNTDRVRRFINKNYRNSREILECGHVLLNHYCNETLAKNEGIKVLKPEYAIRQSAKPFACKSNDSILAAWQIANDWIENGYNGFQISLVSVNTQKYPLSEIVSLAPDGIKCSILSGDYFLKPEEVVISDIQDIKGFEFNLVIIIGLENGIFPPKGHAEKEAWRDALRLYVAITRARDEVCIVYNGPPSQFLKAMKDSLSEKEIFFDDKDLIKWNSKKSNHNSKASKKITDTTFKEATFKNTKPHSPKRTNIHFEEEKYNAKSKIVYGKRAQSNYSDGNIAINELPQKQETFYLNGYNVITINIPANIKSVSRALGKSEITLKQFFHANNEHFDNPRKTIPPGWITRAFLKYNCVPKFNGLQNETVGKSKFRPVANVKTYKSVTLESTGRSICKTESCRSIALINEDYCLSCAAE